MPAKTETFITQQTNKKSHNLA